jgi:Short C-terminal domain
MTDPIAGCEGAAVHPNWTMPPPVRRGDNLRRNLQRRKEFDMFRRRRPLMRAAMVGGVAYHAGKKVQQGREQDAMTEERLEDLEAQQQQPQQSAAPPPAPAGGMSPEVIEQLKQLAQLKDAGVLTQEEFDQQKRKLLS